MARRSVRKTAGALLFLLIFIIVPHSLAHPEQTETLPVDYWLGKEAAEEMINRATTKMAKVYPYVALQIATEFSLGTFEGRGLDIGAGPGRSTLEIAKLTPKMHWVNLDINKHFFPYFMEQADSLGLTDRVEGIQGRADSIPFGDGTFDFVISRGSYKFWGDLGTALKEVLRVMKPGGYAYIGRGLPGILPVELARELRKGQSGKRRFPLEDDIQPLRDVLENAPVETYWISKPQPPGSEGLIYGLWFMFRKPL